MAHHPVGDGSPESVGSHLAALDRPAAPGQTVDPGTQNGQGRGHGGQGQQGRAEGGRDGAQTQRPDHLLGKDEHSGEGTYEQQRGKAHGAARGENGPPDRVVRRGAGAEFFPEPTDDEQSVIDGQTETQKGGDVEGKGIDRGEHGQQPKRPERAEHRQRGDENRHRRGGQSAEDHHQQNQGQRKRHRLGDDEVGLQLRVERIVDHGLAGQLGVDSGNLQHGQQIVVRRPITRPGMLQGHRRERSGAIGGAQVRFLDHGHRPVGVDALDPGAIESGEVPGHLGSDVVDALPGWGGVDGDDVRLPAAEVLLDLVRDVRGFAPVVEEALEPQMGEDPQPPCAAEHQRGDGHDQHEPPACEKKCGPAGHGRGGGRVGDVDIVIVRPDGRRQRTGVVTAQPAAR